eukprot:7665614-Prorocentrum_lima.AAC.1
MDRPPAMRPAGQVSCSIFDANTKLQRPPDTASSKSRLALHPPPHGSTHCFPFSLCLRLPVQVA